MPSQTMTSDDVVKIIESLRGANLRRLSHQEIDERVSVLWSIYKKYATGMPAGLWIRGRRCSRDGWNNLRKCIYHDDASKVKLGRANLPNEPVFYASDNMNTALDELHAAAGEFIHTVVVRARHGFPALIVGNLWNIMNSGRSVLGVSQFDRQRDLKFMLLDESRKTILIDAFFAEQFARPSMIDYEYKITATVAAKVLPDVALIYPSVRNPGGLNLAVSRKAFDEWFEVLFTEVQHVQKYFGYGLYEVEPARRTGQFEDNGDIVWASRKDIEFRQSYTSTDMEVSGPDVNPWRPGVGLARP